MTYGSYKAGLYVWAEYFLAVARGHSLLWRVRSDVIVPLLYKEPEFYPQLKAFVGWSEGEYELL